MYKVHAGVQDEDELVYKVGGWWCTEKGGALLQRREELVYRMGEASVQSGEELVK